MAPRPIFITPLDTTTAAAINGTPTHANADITEGNLQLRQVVLIDPATMKFYSSTNPLSATLFVSGVAVSGSNAVPTTQTNTGYQNASVTGAGTTNGVVYFGKVAQAAIVVAGLICTTAVTVQIKGHTSANIYYALTVPIIATAMQPFTIVVFPAVQTVYEFIDIVVSGTITAGNINVSVFG